MVRYRSILKVYLKIKFDYRIKNHQVLLIWVPRHQGIDDNDKDEEGNPLELTSKFLAITNKIDDLHLRKF